jgi:molybdopterin-containing oxidoreductase family iron-sulfur binding subunit
VVPNEALRRITACAQACPADAITFGNVKDGEGEVHHKFQDERAYTMLGELNTKPGVRYLARIHHNPSKLHHGGGHGGDAEHSAPAGEAHGHKAE